MYLQLPRAQDFATKSVRNLLNLRMVEGYPSSQIAKLERSRVIADAFNIPQRVRLVVPHRGRACYGDRCADSGLGQTPPPDDECLAYYPDAAPHDLVAGP